MDKNFKLGSFIDMVSSTEGLTQQHVETYTRTTIAMRACLDNEHTSPELLDSITFRELEWAYNAIMYWPSYEQDIEIEDWDHEGVQHHQIYSFIKELGKKKSIKKKVAFI